MLPISARRHFLLLFDLSFADPAESDLRGLGGWRGTRALCRGRRCRDL
ncbi:MAG: hypothetical protein ACO2ZK_08770 [Gemmobacter sp.]